jgi:hypothetical protein
MVDPSNPFADDDPILGRPLGGFEPWLRPDPAELRISAAFDMLRLAMPTYNGIFSGPALSSEQMRRAISSFLDLGRNVAKVAGHATPARDIAGGLLDELGIKHEGDI